MGPAASVLIESSSLEDCRPFLAQMVNTIGNQWDPRQTLGNLDFSVGDTISIEGSYVGEGRPLNVSLHELNSPEHELDLEPETLDVLAQSFRIRPNCVVDIYAGCNKAEDHRVLGEVCLHISKHFDAIVDFNGAITPPGTWSWEASWSDVASHAERFLTEISPTCLNPVIAVPYSVTQGRTWASHYTTSEFLENWLQSEHFHMIK